MNPDSDSSSCRSPPSAADRPSGGGPGVRPVNSRSVTGSCWRSRATRRSPTPSRCRPGPMIMLPVIGVDAADRRAPHRAWRRISTTAVGRYFKQPVVHARALVRLAIEGEVAHPGFYAVPTDVVLGDVLMAAGGLTTEAKMTEPEDRPGRTRSHRRRTSSSSRWRRVSTLDDLGLRAGDRIYIPRLVRRDMESNVRILSDPPDAFRSRSTPSRTCA